jgi:hypothetical protein
LKNLFIRIQKFGAKRTEREIDKKSKRDRDRDSDKEIEKERERER